MRCLRHFSRRRTESSSVRLASNVMMLARSNASTISGLRVGSSSRR
jgi:hypothetical protein